MQPGLDPRSRLALCDGVHKPFDILAVDGGNRHTPSGLAAGGRDIDNGGPGLRTQYNPDYYAAFVVTPDAYRIEAYCGPAET
jgi:hypothetical protein